MKVLSLFRSLDGLIRANSFRVPELNPFFCCESRFGAAPLKIANRRFEAIRANRQNIAKMGVYFIDLLMGLFKGAVFDHGRLPENSPLALMGRFPSLMGLFSDLNGQFPRMPCWAVFPLENSPLRKGALRGSRLARIDSRESPRFALRIAGPSI